VLGSSLFLALPLFVVFGMRGPYPGRDALIPAGQPIGGRRKSTSAAASWSGASSAMW
jgi:hypothetical protein